MTEPELSREAVEAVWRRVRGEEAACGGAEEAVLKLHGLACRQAERLRSLSACLGRKGGQTVGRLAAETCSRSRRLAAIYFLMTGRRPAAPQALKQQKADVPARLREAFSAERELADLCREAAEQSPAHRAELLVLAGECECAAARLAGLVPLWL